jgi:hypothetical protein
LRLWLKDSPVEDAKKAEWYLKRLIDQLEWLTALESNMIFNGLEWLVRQYVRGEEVISSVYIVESVLEIYCVACR